LLSCSRTGHTGVTEDDKWQKGDTKVTHEVIVYQTKQILEQGKMILTPDETAQGEPDQVTKAHSYVYSASWAMPRPTMHVLYSGFQLH
jgi:hypothetical protein